MAKTNAVSGFGGSVTLSASAVAEVKQWSGTINNATADVTHLGSSGYVNRISTTKDFTGNFTSNSFLTLTGPAARTAIFKVGATTSTSKPSITCRIFHSTGVEVPGDAVEFSHDFESDGPIAVATS